ncbi:TPA: hypothetical protein MJA07_22560 [Klebsiella pneumoniae]|nr:hypothetical protein [Klebsiella pneumoniae]
MHIIFTLIISVTNENNRKLPQCGPGRRWQASAEPRDRRSDRVGMHCSLAKRVLNASHCEMHLF